MYSRGFVSRSHAPARFCSKLRALFFNDVFNDLTNAMKSVDEVKPDAQTTARRYPASRIVLSPGAAVELINRMQQIGAALIQAGLAKTASARGQKPPSQP
jgi:hypothetical protein